MTTFHVIVKNIKSEEKLSFEFYTLNEAYAFVNVIKKSSDYLISIIEIEKRN